MASGVCPPSPRKEDGRTADCNEYRKLPACTRRNPPMDLPEKKIERVVIPMMIFVHVDVAERSQVLTLSAISRYMVLHGEHTPAVIPDEQMERFKFMLDYSDEAVEMCAAPLVPGELIRVVKGPLKGLEGELVEVDGKAKVVVRLDLLGCAGVDMPVGFVEKMK